MLFLSSFIQYHSHTYALSFLIDADNFNLYMLMDAYYRCRVAYKLFTKLGYMYQTIFFNTYINKTTEVGDVGYNAR